MRAREFIIEKVNPDMADRNFRAEKDIDIPNVGTLKLIAQGMDTDYPHQFVVNVMNQDDEQVGRFRFVMMKYNPEKRNMFGFKVVNKEDPYVIGGNVSVWNEYQKKGIATQVYKFVKELGNDIRPSTTQSPAGKAMWKSFDRKKDIAEAENNNPIADKIFFARSNKSPKSWSYDHVGFITQDGKQIQMSGHKGNDVYVTDDVTDDPEFSKQDIKIVPLSKSVSVPRTNSVGAENCGTFVANVLQANGVKGLDTKKIYSIFKQPQQNIVEGYDNTTFKVERRKLNVPALIKLGAIFVTYPHSEQGWETDNEEDWAFSLISLYNVLKGSWPKEAKKYLKPNSYKKAAQQINSSAPNLGSDKLVYDGKYNQILWSIKKLGIPDNVAFLDNDQQDITEDSFDGIDIDMDIEDDEIMVTAMANGRELGHVLFVDEGEYLMPQDLEVDERFQGQGIAAAMYDYVKSKGYKIRRSGQQTDAGAGFWNKHRPEQNVWESTADDINKMFNNMYDPMTTNLQRVALMAMQGRQDEAVMQLNRVIKDASPEAQKKITDAVNNIKPVTVNGKIADSSTLDKSKQHQDWILNTFIPWVQSLLDKQGMTEEQQSTPTMGINVRSDGDIDYASLIIDGRKKYESRQTDSLRPYVGKTVAIVRTGKGPAVAIGQVTVGEPVVVDAEKFNKMRKQHLVPQGSKFDIDPGATKYLYPMIDPVRWDREKLVKQKGIVARKIDDLDENFADGKVKGKSRPGRVKRAGASCNGSVTDLRARAKNASGEKAKMYHWCANMKSGRNK